ncbi:MAG: hypothetical protein R3Y07_10065 [Eubacteriales bacterium]
MTTKTMKRVTIGLTSALLLYGFTQRNITEEQPQNQVPPLNVVSVVKPTLPLIEVDFVNEEPIERVHEDGAVEENFEPTPTIEPPIEQAPVTEIVPEISSEVTPQPQPNNEPQPTQAPEAEPSVEPNIESDPTPVAPPPSTSVLHPNEDAPSDDMIWVAGFGWLPVGEPAVTIEADSTGDINKMVGIL